MLSLLVACRGPNAGTFCSPTLQGRIGAEAPLAAHPTSAGDSAAYERRVAALDDVVVVSACRTALCKARRGGFKDTPVDDLVAAVLKETIRRTGVEPEVGGWCWGGERL